MRSRPAVKRELPPASSSGARSSRRTRFAVSLAESAAHSAALPPPTTMTSKASTRRGSGGRACGRAGLQEAAQNVRQDAAVDVVIHLDRRVDAQEHLDLLGRPVLAA